MHLKALSSAFPMLAKKVSGEKEPQTAGKPAKRHKAMDGLPIKV